MLDKEAVENYKHKKLKSWLWIKDKSLSFDRDEYNFKFKTNPYDHQLRSFICGMLNDNFLFFLEMGMGKTKITLDVLSNRRDDWNRTLILSPNASSVYTWGDEIKKHSDFSNIELMGKTEDRWFNILNKSELICLNYTGLLYMVTTPKNGRWLIDDNKVKKFSSMFDAVIFDEIHNLKNHQSLTFRVCSKITKNYKLRYGLTGTPINRDVLALWSQFFVTDRGETLGESISLYREAYFTEKNGYWGGKEWKFQKKYEEELNYRITNKSIRYSEEEALDLPDIVFTDIPIILKDEAAKFYAPTYEEYVESGRNKKDLVAGVPKSFAKLRQICSGFIYVTDEESKETITLESNKNEALIELIKDTPDKSKVIVFLDHIASGDIVSEALTKEKIKFSKFYGKHKDGMKKFIDNKDCKVMVTNTKKGGISVNLQIANYVIFYELPLSSIDYKQALKRTHRLGQTKRVFVYSLITKDTIEEKIKKFIEEGKDIFKAIIEGDFVEKPKIRIKNE